MNSNRVMMILILAVSLAVVGCATIPMYDLNGNYKGSRITIDINRIADMGTFGAIGGLFGMAVGKPVLGFALGAGIGGVTHGYAHSVTPLPAYNQQRYYPPSPWVHYQTQPRYYSPYRQR